VSGGPIYISDNPAEPTDTALLSRTLGTPCLQSLLPVRESLFSSPAAPDLLRLFNENRCSGVVFAANVFGAEWSGGKYAQTTPPKTLSSTVSPRMVGMRERRAWSGMSSKCALDSKRAAHNALRAARRIKRPVQNAI